jgi:hypothetical protein
MHDLCDGFEELTQVNPCQSKHCHLKIQKKKKMVMP